MGVKKAVLILMFLWLGCLTFFIFKDNKSFYQDAYSIKLTSVNWCVEENGSGETIKEIKVKVKQHKVYVKLELWNNQTVERVFDRNKLIYIDYI